MDGFSRALIREYGPVADVARYTLYHATEGEVLASHDRSTLCAIVEPEPVAASDVEVELIAMNEMFAETEPAAVGANVTLKGTHWPAVELRAK